MDLGEPRMVGRVNIAWENAYSKVFSILTSLDCCEWKNVFRETAGQGGISQIKFAPVKTRHVRINCEQRGTQWGNAIREFQVFE